MILLGLHGWHEWTITLTFMMLHETLRNVWSMVFHILGQLVLVLIIASTRILLLNEIAFDTIYL